MASAYPPRTTAFCSGGRSPQVALYSSARAPEFSGNGVYRPACHSKLLSADRGIA
jgi:hypothetical protein